MSRHPIVMQARGLVKRYGQVTALGVKEGNRVLIPPAWLAR
jgi:hypothetical protein